MMKRIACAALLLLLVIAIFTGCGKDKSPVQSSQGEAVLSQIAAMKEQNKKPKEIFDYLSQNIQQLDKAQATAGLGILINRLESCENGYSEQLFADRNADLMLKYFGSGFDYSKIDGIQEQDLKSLLQEITLGGFKIVDAEGSFAVVVDYPSLKTFGGYVENEINTYIDIMAQRYDENNNNMTMDQLATRIMQMESYILSSNSEQRKDTITEMYAGDIMIYMSGMENAPVFDEDTGMVDAKRYTSFETAASKYKDAAFGKIMSRYVQLLTQESFINTDKVQGFLTNIGETVKDQLSMGTKSK
jgi:hypothetical protein